MSRGRAVSGMRLRLLAIVLAVALTWYAMNPAPGPLRRVKEGKEPPDEEQRERETPAPSGFGLEIVESGIGLSPTPPLLAGSEPDADDLDWPDLIDL